MVDAEDFRAVTDTYPKHPISDYAPINKTKTELIQHRHNLEKQDIKKKKDHRDA